MCTCCHTIQAQPTKELLTTNINITLLTAGIIRLQMLQLLRYAVISKYYLLSSLKSTVTMV